MSAECMLDMHSLSGMHPYFGGPHMRKWLVFVLLLGILVFPTPAGAQGGIKMKSINVNLWSEYDQPSMLVIHEFTLDEGTPLPAKVTIRFPKDGNLIAAAYCCDQNGTLITTDVEKSEVQGSWQTVTLNVDSYVPYRIEYYQPLVRDGNRRSFNYQWLGDYPVAEYNLLTQIPADSTNVTAEPPFTESGPSQDGKFLIGRVIQKDLGIGQPSEFKLSYERDSESVTKPINPANIQPSEPIGPSTEGRISIDNLPWIIGGIGLALIGLALFFYWRSTQVPEHKSRRRRSASSQESEEGSEQAYCHECGARAHSGDRFCRTCGSKLRV
jgi:hypothetical protein